jgi:hypothetical protein
MTATPMRLSLVGSIAILALSCYLPPSVVAQAADKGLRPMGAGAFPLSFTHASAWFAYRANENEKALIVLFFFQGNPGWLNQKADFKWQVNGSPASIDMVVGKVPVRAKDWPETDDVEVGGSKYKRSSSNVFLVTGIDGAKPAVTPLGIHDLTFKGDEIPPITLLKRDADVWAAVTGHSPSDHPTRQKSGVPEEIVAWDAEGLRLLLTEKPEQERKGCELFRRAALKGYAPSQYRLGYCYESGRGAEQSFSTANDWYEKAAVQGFVDAQYKLGHSYRTGRGVQIDLATALRWYRKAADAGDADALQNVGWMYATGQGVKADQQEAFRWFLQAAQRGETGAQFEVARRLKDGDGISKNIILAYSWLLVLQTQQATFQPDDWGQVQAMLTAVEGQLDSGAKQESQEPSRKWMAVIAANEMEAYSKQ